jgi:hypothetical protein
MSALNGKALNLRVIIWRLNENAIGYSRASKQTND